MLELLLGEVAAVFLRGAHVLAAAAWVGAALRLLLVRDRLHGTAVKHVIQPYAGALFGTCAIAQPAHGPVGTMLPLRWAPYATWLAGFALLLLVYYAQADIRMVDHEAGAADATGAVLAGLGSLLAGYLLYESLCRLAGGAPGWLFGAAAILLLVLAGIALDVVMQTRAALLHLGAVLGTCMAANVGHVIAPYERRLARASDADQAPPAELRQRAMLRVRHNEYMIFPTLFLMLAGHVPMASSPRSLPVLLIAVTGLGFALREALGLRHRRPRRARMALFAVPPLLVVLGWSLWPAVPARRAVHDHPTTAAVLELTERRCSMCHASAANGARPAGGVALDSEVAVRAHARGLVMQAGLGRAMPPGNVTAMTAEERRLVVDWYRLRPDPPR